MSPTIKCFDFPMKLREIKCQRILTSTKVSEEASLGYELFVSKIPPDVDEDELIPFFETIGPLHTFRLMMKNDQCTNRGHAYLTYIRERDAKDAVFLLNGKEIRKGQYISVTRSFNNCRIFIGGIPVNKTKDEVWHELQKQNVPNIIDVIMYRSYSNRNLNRGFVFVEFPSHKFAAKMRLKLRGIKLWNYEVVVDWSVPQPVVTEEEMARVKIIYLRNLNVTDTKEDLRAIIENFVKPEYVEKVYKFKDYAFVHLSTRELALELIDLLKEHYKNTFVEVALAKPRNHFTKPGYRKYQMMKNNPYLPHTFTESQNSAPNRFHCSSPFDIDCNLKPSDFASMQNWSQCLPSSPSSSLTSINPYTLCKWDENDQYLNEDKEASIFQLNFPLTYQHVQNGVNNISRYHELKELEGLSTSIYNARDTYTSDNGPEQLVSAIKNILIEEDYYTGYSHIMSNLNYCCPRDYLWKVQNICESNCKY